MEQFNLNWHTYNDHLKDMMQNLLQSNESTDVTLVCEDKSKFKAHKFVLNACSPVFQSIINDLPQKDPVIYLRGVLAPEMKSILQFMYLGQATFYQDRMNEFLEVAKSLEIKEISKDVECDDVDIFGNHDNVEHNSQLDKEVSKNDKAFENKSYVLEELDQTDTKVQDFKEKAGQYQCNKCEKHYSNYPNLQRHYQSAHEGIRYPCNKCNQTFTEKAKLRRHIENVHDGVKFPCHLCDHIATQKASLNAHMKNKH